MKCPACDGHAHGDYCPRRRIYPACRACKGMGRIGPPSPPPRWIALDQYRWRGEIREALYTDLRSGRDEWRPVKTLLLSREGTKEIIMTRTLS